MKILIVCDQGVNRSVVLGSRLRYCGDGHDVLTAGLATNDPATLEMLILWADKIILTDKSQYDDVRGWFKKLRKVELWNIGPDKYPRPHNKELLAIVTQLIKDHPELTQKTTRSPQRTQKTKT